MAGQEEKLPTLTITFQQLQERSKLFTGDRYSSHQGVNSAAGKSNTNPQNEKVYSGGLLYISPTKEAPKAEERVRRTKGRSIPSQDSRSQRRLFNHEETPRTQKTTPNQEKAPPSKRVTQRRGKFSQEGSQKDMLVKADSDQSASDILKDEWSRYENKRVEKALSKWSGDLIKLKPVIHACEKMQGCAAKILMNDMELYSKLDISGKLWKMGHYPIIESLRAKRDVPSEGSTYKETLEKFLASSTDFYSKLPNMVESQLSFKISQLLSNQLQFSSKTHHRKVMVGAVLCHGWYISLGDLSRYQQQLLPTQHQNWSSSRRFYLKAQQLAPKNGKPYNQLAVTAINSHRRLDAVYYYVRSLSTKPPFQSAYDSLVGIFADTSRKAERHAEEEREAKEKLKNLAAKKQKKAERRKAQQKRKQGINQKKGGGEGGTLVEQFSSGKKEIWMLPSVHDNPETHQQVKSHDLDAKSHDQAHAEVEEDIDFDLPSHSAVRKASSAFVLVHSKLFTRTGVETLPETMSKACQYLGLVLRGELRLEYAQLLLKMMVINLFSVHHTAECSESVGYYCGVGLGLTLRLASVMLATCINKLQTLDKNMAYNNTTSVGNTAVAGGEDEMVKETKTLPTEVLDHLSVVLPAVRIVYDWMLSQQQLYWSARAVTKHLLLSEFWSTTVIFVNMSYDFLGASPQLAPPLELWEDRVLAGFMPLKETLSTRDTFAILDVRKMTVEEHREQCVGRVSLVTSLCHQHSTSAQGSQDLTFDPETGHFALAPEEGGSGPGEARASGVEGEKEGESPAGLVEEEEEVEEAEVVEGEVVDLEESFGFSDSDSEAVIELSSEEGGEEEGEEGGEGRKEEPGVAQLKTHMSELGLSDMGSGDDTLSLSTDSDRDVEIEQLKAQRDGLVRRMEERDMAIKVAKDVLNEVAARAGQEMFITPKYLVPDTNCFVDMLASIKTLVQRGEFVIAVSLVVMTELEGLSKGSDGPETAKPRDTTKSGKSNPAKVTEGAKSALEYIKACFQEKAPSLRMVTTQGSLLSSLSFREQITGKASNDDLILESCLQLHAKTQGASKPGARLCYKVVLLTDDRNLRVKAHASNQPVKDIPDFMKLLPKDRK